jgi:hypothetical protein
MPSRVEAFIDPLDTPHCDIFRRMEVQRIPESYRFVPVLAVKLSPLSKLMDRGVRPARQAQADCGTIYPLKSLFNLTLNGTGFLL